MFCIEYHYVSSRLLPTYIFNTLLFSKRVWLFINDYWCASKCLPSICRVFIQSKLKWGLKTGAMWLPINNQSLKRKLVKFLKIIASIYGGWFVPFYICSSFLFDVFSPRNNKTIKWHKSASISMTIGNAFEVIVVCSMETYKYRYRQAGQYS